MAASDTDTIPRLDALEGWPAPEARAEWFGDPGAERTLLDAYRSGRMHHAWLIGGPRGIGKATLAYRFARFVLAHPDPSSPEVVAASDLSLSTDSSAFRRVARRAHPNLLVLERPWDAEKKRYRTELTIPEIRRTVSFFGSTAGEAGWRIAIVDPADDMNANAANALLKVLEEPPVRALFLVVAHAPGRIMATIRSRCRKLDLAPLPAEAIVDALAANDTGPADADLGFVAALAEGSLRRAILLRDEEMIETVRSFFRLIGSLPRLNIPALHDFADAIAGRGADDAYETFLDVLRGWLDRRVRGAPEPGAGAPPALAAVPLARWAEVWEKVNRSAALADALNLDRKQVVLSIFMTLAHATRM